MLLARSCFHTLWVVVHSHMGRGVRLGLWARRWSIWSAQEVVTRSGHCSQTGSGSSLGGSELSISDPPPRWLYQLPLQAAALLLLPTPPPPPPPPPLKDVPRNFFQKKRSSNLMANVASQQLTQNGGEPWLSRTASSPPPCQGNASLQAMNGSAQAKTWHLPSQSVGSPAAKTTSS